MGNAKIIVVKLMSETVHPHVHGERISHFFPHSPQGGSSPRTWGTLSNARWIRAIRRFIPTYMGNACDPYTCSRSMAVHPHVHGERPIGSTISNDGIGSSPRTWGTRDRDLYPEKRSRFIPTYMGNAWKLACVWGQPCGSSPRTWGTRIAYLEYLKRHRFIPTYMGNALLRQSPHVL